MKKIVYLLLAVAIAFPAAAKKKTFALPPQNIINQALDVMREFVRNGDTKLGFAPGDKLQRARVDKKHPVAFYYVREDSLLVSDNLENIFIDMKRVMYPVFLDGRIRGSITFAIRQGAWKAVEFADSIEIARLLRIKNKLRLGKGKEDVTVAAFMPTSKHTIYLEGDNLASAKVTSPNFLDTADAMEFHGEAMRFLNTPRISMQQFIRGYREYINRVEDN